MKTKLLKQLRKEAEAKIPIIQTQMRDMGAGEDRFEVFYMLRSKTNNRIIALWASLMEIGRLPLDGSWLPMLDCDF